MTSSTAALKDSLRRALLKYRAQRPQLSLRSIARNSGVNRYFLNKVMDENDTTSPLDLNQVLVLFKFMTERESVKEVIDASVDDVQAAIQNIFDIEFLSKKDIADSYEGLDFYDMDTYFVMVLASFGHGTKDEYVMRILGERGEQALARLLREGYVYKTNQGRIKLKKGNDFTYSMDVMRHHIPNYLRFYNRDRVGRGINRIHVYAEGLNQQGIEKAHDLHARLNRELQLLLSDESNYGDIPFFSFAVMDRMID